MKSIGELKEKNRMFKEATSRYEKRLAPGWFLSIPLSLLALMLIWIWGCGWIRRLLRAVCDYDLLYSNLRNKMDFLGTAVWTLTTILSAFVTLYYSSLGSRNYGLQNRKIISYSYGSVFIPFLVIWNGIVACGMTYYYYTGGLRGFYLLSGYSFFLQAYLISLCVYSTTRYKAFKTIIRIEQAEFGELCMKEREAILAPDSAGAEAGFQREKERFVYHLDSVLRWNEPMTEKQEMIRHILLLPLGDTMLEVHRVPRAMYAYLYHNFRLIVSHMKGRVRTDSDMNDILEIEEIYNIIYKSLPQTGENPAADPNMLKIAGVYYGAFFNAFLAEKMLSDRWKAISYIMNEIVKDDELRRFLILELIIAAQLQASLENLSLDGDTMEEMILAVRSMRGADAVRQKAARLSEEEHAFYGSFVRMALEETTENSLSRYSIWIEIEKGLRGEGRHDVMDVLLNL